jgi:hypothetical protein
MGGHVSPVSSRVPTTSLPEFKSSDVFSFFERPCRCHGLRCYHSLQGYYFGTAKGWNNPGKLACPTRANVGSSSKNCGALSTVTQEGFLAVAREAIKVSTIKCEKTSITMLDSTQEHAELLRCTTSVFASDLRPLMQMSGDGDTVVSLRASSAFSVLSPTVPGLRAFHH